MSNDTSRKKYRGLSHQEIIQRQRKRMWDVLRETLPPVDFDLNASPEREAIRRIKAYTDKWAEEKEEKERASGSKKRVNAKQIQKRIDAYEKRLRINDFKLGGLGESAKGCGEVIASEINIGENEDGIYGIRYHPIDCLRIQCPKCYGRWVVERTFNIVIRIEAMSLIKGERPYHVIFSVPPDECKGWTWTNINDRLWKRGIRHLKRIRCKKAREFDISKIKDWNHNVEDCPNCKDLTVDEYAGIGVFHPLRVKKKYKLKWNADPDPDDFGDLADAGKFWKKIRYCIAHGINPLSEYAKLGFHAHNWIFNDHPHRHKDPKFLVKYLKEGGEFKRFSTKEVIALTRYLLTHTCTINEKTTYTAHRCEYCGHFVISGYMWCPRCGREAVERVETLRNRIVHPTRSYGSLLNFNPKKELIKKFGKKKGKRLYNQLAEKVCSLIILGEDKKGNEITLEWDAEAEDIFYPALHRSKTPPDGENWVSIWKIFDLLADEEFVSHLTVEELDFLDDLADYLKTKGKPPPLKECSHIPCAGLFYVPSSIIVDAPKFDDYELFGLGDFELQEKVLKLIDKGEDDIWKLDICIPDYPLGDILSTVNRLVGDGVINDVGGDLSLNYADVSPGGFELPKPKPVKRGVSDVSKEVVRLVGEGIRDPKFVRSHFSGISDYKFSTVLDKLVEDGMLIKQPDGELVLGV